MEIKKIKVVWICHFSDNKFNEKLPLKVGYFYKLIYKLLKYKEVSTKISDFAIWNINALNEIKNFTDLIELHVIAPYPFLSASVYEYIEDNIYYHFFRTNTMLIDKILNRYPSIYYIFRPSYFQNRIKIKSLIKKLKPSLIHIIGAENPYYSISALDIPRNIKLIVQLQTLMSDPKFFTTYPIDKKSYKFRSNVEKKVIKRANFIGTTVQGYKSIISELINPNANFIDISLPLGENIETFEVVKRYDFVYFARLIRKACDWAIESFIQASRIKPGITMLIVGGYTQEEKQQYENTLSIHGLLNQVTFTGELPTHNEVLKEVSKARVALLPLKFDFLPGTIREANALGLPVVTSITDGTPRLNEKRKCALLSEGGNHHEMAINMIQVLENTSLAKELVTNSFIRLQETYNNYNTIESWVKFYKSIL